MFINISNTLSKDWEPNQIQEAQKWGKIIDIEFPYIDSTFGDDVVETIVDEIKDKIKKLSPKKGDCVCISCCKIEGNEIIKPYLVTGDCGSVFDIIDYVHSCFNFVTCVYPVFGKYEICDPKIRFEENSLSDEYEDQKEFDEKYPEISKKLGSVVFIKFRFY